MTIQVNLSRAHTMACRAIGPLSTMIVKRKMNKTRLAAAANDLRSALAAIDRILNELEQGDSNAS